MNTEGGSITNSQLQDRLKIGYQYHVIAHDHSKDSLAASEVQFYW